MKSILLYANKDAAILDRLDAALNIAAAFDSHLHCLQVTPYEDYVVTDPFGGAYPAMELVEAIRAKEAANRSDMEGRLQRAGACWDWADETGNPDGTALDRMNLVDLAVVSLPGDENPHRSPAIAKLATRAATPVLAVASGGARFDVGGKVLVAWNGSAEASRALVQAAPLLKRAANVYIATVAESSDMPSAILAAEYLGYHGIKAEVGDEPLGDGTVSDAILCAAEETGSSYIVMGAYGHSRLRETIFGGVTRSLCERSPYSLFLAH